MTYEGPIWRVDYRLAGKLGALIVLAETINKATEMARQQLPSAEVVGLYTLPDVQRAVFQV